MLDYRFNKFLTSFARSLVRFFDERYTYRSSALAFTTLLAIVPFLLVMTFFIALFPIVSESFSSTEKYVLANFVPASSSIIQNYLHIFIQQAKQLPAISIAFLFFTALMLVYTIEETINDIWNATSRKRYVLNFLMYWLILFLFPLVIGISVSFSYYLISLTWMSDSLKIFIPILINTFIFSMIYIITPNTKVTISIGFFGGLIAAVLFEITRLTFAMYLIMFPTYGMIYGIFATIPIFLIWLYICWSIILFGAIFTNTYTLAKANQFG